MDMRQMLDIQMRQMAGELNHIAAQIASFEAKLMDAAESSGHPDADEALKRNAAIALAGLAQHQRMQKVREEKLATMKAAFDALPEPAAPIAPAGLA